jgi:hypothetical protein
MENGYVEWQHQHMITYEWSFSLAMLKKKVPATYGSVSKPCTPSVHIKIAGTLW